MFGSLKGLRDPEPPVDEGHDECLVRKVTLCSDALIHSFFVEWKDEPEQGQVQEVRPGESPDGQNGRDSGRSVVDQVEAEQRRQGRRVGRGVPGKMYLNGRRNLLSLFRTSAQLAAWLGRERPLSARLRRARHSQRITFGEDGYGQPNAWLVTKDEPTSHQAARRCKPQCQVIVDYVVLALWPGQPDDEPNWSQLCDESATAQLDARDAGMEQWMEKIQLQLLSAEDEALAESESEMDALADAKWSLVHYFGPTARQTLPDWPDLPAEKERQSAAGVLAELHRPHGGIIEMDGGERVYFHRSRLLVDGRRLGYTSRLDDHVAVGDRVLVDLVNNGSDGEKQILPDAPTARLGLWVHKGPVLPPDRLPAKVTQDFKKLFDQMYRLKVTKLFLNEKTGRYDWGLGYILPGPHQTSKNPHIKIGAYARFHVKDLFFLGFSLENICLTWLVKNGEELPVVLARVSKSRIKGEIKYKVVRSSLYRINKDNAALDRLPELCPAAGLIHLEAMRKGLHFEQLEQIIMGWPAQEQEETTVDGLPDEYVHGVVSDLIPGKAGSRGAMRVTQGPLKDSTITFDRADCSVFGWDLAGADLSLFALQFDRATCLFHSIGADSTSSKVMLGRPHVSDRDPAKMTSVERLDFLSFLCSHGMTYGEFQAALKDCLPAEPYIPFPKGTVRGIVTRLLEGDSNMQTKGAIGGHAVLDLGFVENDVLDTSTPAMIDLNDQTIAFSRQHFWCFGKKMHQADLSFFLPPAQKIQFELKPISEEDRRKNPSLYCDFKYEALLAWMGTFRPRGGLSKFKDDGLTAGEKPRIEWLTRLKIGTDQFDRQAEGKFEPLGPADKNKDGFSRRLANFQERREDRRAAGDNKRALDRLKSDTSRTWEDRSDPTLSMPVVKHGLDLAHMVEGAIMATGPQDPGLASLVMNDEMAKKAHHISMALQHAVTLYKDNQLGRHQQQYGSARATRFMPQQHQYPPAVYPAGYSTTRHAAGTHKKRSFSNVENSSTNERYGVPPHIKKPQYWHK